MTEYWVNVYGRSDTKVYYPHNSLKDAISGMEWALGTLMTAYRIHVKMKPVKPKYDEKHQLFYKIDRRIG